MWRSTVQKFSSGGDGFDPSFGETDKVRVVGVDQIRQCSRMKRMENGADVESAQSEVCWARIQFNVTRKEEKGEEKQTADWVGTPWECCWQAVRCREGWTWQEGEENRSKKDKTAQVITEMCKRFMVRNRWQRNETKKTKRGER